MSCIFCCLLFQASRWLCVILPVPREVQRYHQQTMKLVSTAYEQACSWRRPSPDVHSCWWYLMSLTDMKKYLSRYGSCCWKTGLLLATTLIETRSSILLSTTFICRRMGRRAFRSSGYGSCSELQIMALNLADKDRVIGAFAGTFAVHALAWYHTFI